MSASNFCFLKFFRSSVDTCSIMLPLLSQHSLLIFWAGKLQPWLRAPCLWPAPTGPRILQNNLRLTNYQGNTIFGLCTNQATIWWWLFRLWHIETFSCDCVWCHAGECGWAVLISLFTSGADKEENHFTWWWWFSLFDLFQHLQGTDHSVSKHTPSHVYPHLQHKSTTQYKPSI